MKTRRTVPLAGLLALMACGGTTAPAPPPPPPPPPPALLATGDWVGDWRFLTVDGQVESVRWTTIITDSNGTLGGSCKFEVLDLLPFFVACDSVTGTRVGDHLSANVALSLSFQSFSGSTFSFSGALQPGVMTGTLSVFSGYEFRPRGGAANLLARRAEAGTPGHDRLLRALESALAPE